VELLVLVHHHRLLVLVLSKLQFLESLVQLNVPHLLFNSAPGILRGGCVSSTACIVSARMPVVGSSSNSTEQIVRTSQIDASVGGFSVRDHSILVNVLLRESRRLQCRTIHDSVGNAILLFNHLFGLESANRRLVSRRLGPLSSICSRLRVSEAGGSELGVEDLLALFVGVVHVSSCAVDDARLGNAVFL
jgi:hypothetical protein